METRHPAVSGVFYYSDKDNLKGHMDSLFSGAKTGNNIGVVSPHAGYEYSGRTAAHAINSLKRVGVFIILGPNHHVLGPEFSIMSEGSWKTPLGEVEIDTETAEKLRDCKILEESSIAHSQEHSIEVQLPFLQYRFKEFKFVPISIINTGFSSEFLKKCELLGSAIADLVKGKDIGIIASSDFSHYLPLDHAKKIDNEAIEKILKLDTKGFFDVLAKHDASICGYGPIAVLISVARILNLKTELIHESSSGDATKDFGSVVTYKAIGFG